MQRIDARTPDFEDVDAIVRALRAGGVVCLPTDTLYGLAVDAASEAAIDRLLRLKGRPEGKPILLLVDSVEMARGAAIMDERFERVARAFWPGPLTIVARSRGWIPSNLTAGTGAIGLRWPNARLPEAVVRAFGGPVTGTSANRSGEPPARSAEDAARALGAGLDVLVDGGASMEEKASTVLDLTRPEWVLLREGPVSRTAIAAVLGEVSRPQSA